MDRLYKYSIDCLTWPFKGLREKRSHMTAMVITCNTVLTSRACSFLTLYFLQMFYYIYINTFIHSTVIPWSETEIKSLTLSLNAKYFGKDEKSRDQSRQVNNYKADAYKGGITQVHRWYQITWGSEEGRSLMPLGFC